MNDRTEADAPHTDVQLPGDFKIQARGTERLYRADTDDPIHALGPIDFEVADGEFVALVGPSGCGKSTFLRCVAGLVRPSQGEVEVKTTGGDRPSVAMVFQDYGIYPWKTVLANVRFGLDVGGIPRDEADARAQHYLRRMGLEDFADAYPDQLSGGMRQRVSIARALAVEPDVLLMDEPFAALDAQLRSIQQEELLSIWEEDRRTVLFVTHSLEEAILLADRVVVMTARPGRLLESVTVPFSRPRSAEVRSDPEFGRLKAYLWDRLRVEVEGQMVERGPREPLPAKRPTENVASGQRRQQTGAVQSRLHRPGPAELYPHKYFQRQRRTDRALAIGVPLALFVLWQVASTFGWIDARTYPSPTMIAAESVRLVADGILQAHTLATVQRVLAGFAIGAFVGVGLGLVMGVWRAVRVALEPLLNGLYTVPKLALLPVFLTIFGFGEAPKIVLIAVTVFFFVWISTMSAIMTVPSGYREAAQAFNVNRWQQFRHVLLPASLPSTFVGLRISAGVSVLVIVAAEFVVGNDGIGFLIFNSRTLFLNQRMYVGIVVSALIGIAFMGMVRWIGRRLTPWAAEDEAVAPT